MRETIAAGLAAMVRQNHLDPGRDGAHCCCFWSVAARPGSQSERQQSASASEATPTPLPTPILPENPIYTVEVGTVVQTLEFTGRASPVLQQELFFETGGNVGEVFVAAGDWVQAGQVLAELDIDNLQQQLSQKLLSLETAEIKFEQSQIEAQEAISTTLANLEDAQADLASSKTTSANDLAEARASVAERRGRAGECQTELDHHPKERHRVRKGAGRRVPGQLVRGILWRVPAKV